MAVVIIKLRAQRMGASTFICAAIGHLKKTCITGPFLEVFDRDEVGSDGTSEALVTEELNNLINQPFFIRSARRHSICGYL
jgi:hypothetical protein